MTQVIRLELVIFNRNKYDSRVVHEGEYDDKARKNQYHADLFGDTFYEEYRPDSFEETLSNNLLQAFENMISLDIDWIKCSASISPIKKGEVPFLLSNVINLNTESMRIFTSRGYVTFSSFKEDQVNSISRALMLLVWKWSPHFVSDKMEGTNDFSSSMRACVVCGKTHHGVRTGQYVGGVKLGFDPSPVREMIAHPYEHCFDPNCFSHEIERMIDPAYIFVPPKPGEDLGGDRVRIIKDLEKDPAVQRFIKDME